MNIKQIVKIMGGQKKEKKMDKEEKDDFKEWLQNEDWHAIEDEIYEYVSQAE